MKYNISDVLRFGIMFHTILKVNIIEHKLVLFL